jgi:hypothetical protein
MNDKKGDYILKPYEITHMIIDDEFYGEETVTTNFTHNEKEYSITFDKSDLEILNTWVFENNTSLPANLSNEIIEAIREDVKKSI